MLPRDVASLTDILNAARLAQSFLADVDRGAFELDPMCQSAVIHQLTIIGEASKRLSAGLRQAHPQIPWQKMAGMRDILIHAYDDVDLDEVWRAVRVAIPELIEQVEPLVLLS